MRSLLLTLLLLMPALPVLASRHDAIAEQMPAATRQQAGALLALTPAGLEAAAAAVREEALAARLRELGALGNLGIAARPVNASGEAPIHGYLRDRFSRLAPRGLRVIGPLRGEVWVPVPVSRPAEAIADAAAEIDLGGTRLPLHPLWPNGPMPSLAPAGGLRGRLVDAGSAQWKDLQGVPLAGSIALVNYSAGRRFEMLFALGAEAVIVAGGDDMTTEHSDGLCMATPLPYPRFFATRAVAEQLRVRAATAPMVTVRGGHVLAARPTASFFAYLPPSPLRRIAVAETALLDAIATEAGSSAAELLALNPTSSAALKAGQVLRLPGKRGSLEIKTGELWRRLSATHATPLAELRAANPGLPDDPAGAFELVLPALADPLVIIAPLDAMSMVPDLPHGGRVAANLALTLTVLEHLADSPAVHRRRGVLFAFIDGDTLGGTASRNLAEQVLLARGAYAALDSEGRVAGLGRYRKAQAFWDGPAEVDADTARWLADDWLRGRHEEIRIHLAEARVALLGTKQRDASSSAALAAIEADIAFLGALRSGTLDRLAGSATARLAAWREAAQAPGNAARLATFGLDLPALAARFRSETAGEATSVERAAGNLATGQALNALLYAPGMDLNRPLLGWQFDFSGATGVIGPAYYPREDIFRTEPRFKPYSLALARRLRGMMALAARAGNWPDSVVFATEDDRSDIAQQRTRPAPLYDEFWAAAGIAMMPLATTNDRAERVDTPLDTVAGINPRGLSLEARQALMLAVIAAESPSDGTIEGRRETQEFTRITGRVAQFNLRSGIDAQDPVAGASVFLPCLFRDPLKAMGNSATWRGYRRGIVAGTRLNGCFELPLESASYLGRPRLYAYALDAERGLFTRVASKGQVGTKPQVPEVVLRRGADTPVTVVLSPLEPLVLFPGSDPMRYRSLTGFFDERMPLRLLDAVLDGPPREFAFDGSFIDFQERNVEGVTVYAPAGRRMRVIAQSGSEYRMLLVGDVGKSGRGAGHAVGPKADGGRGVFLPFTPQRIASDMVGLARHRLDLFGAYGIRDAALDEAVARAEERLAVSRAAAAKADWQLSVGAARQAWGTIERNYSRILDMGREAVFSVILLMAALVPAAWFLERLLIGARSIVARLAGTVALLALGVLFLNAFHPAFRIALSPFIIVIAFTMILMSVIVLAICYGRFDTLLRRARNAGGEVEAEEIGFAASLATAFSLGVANLRKRASRTVLTVFTIGTLAFAIVAFVAVTGRDTLKYQPLELDRLAGGAPVAPLPPAYDGLMLREFSWQEFPRERLTAMEAEFGATLPVVARASYIEVEGGNLADMEGVNQIPVSRAGQSSVQTAILCFDPRETGFSALHQAVGGGAWFQPRDRHHVILPDAAAARLGLTPQMIFDSAGKRRPDAELPVVTFSGQQWRVVGIIDAAHANRIRDVNGRSLALVDYLRSGMNRNTLGDIENEGSSYHLDWARMIAVPLAAMDDVGARMRSVAIKLPQGSQGDAVLADIAGRLEGAAFLNREGATSLVVTRRDVKLSGLARLAVPVLLCVLIVMNTMMGAVDERRGEVAMLGAIGLSPRQIAFLLLSEATVYSILAFVMGTFGGLAFANALAAAQAAGWAVLPGLSFNFTSLLSMSLATLTGGIVLLATLLPARRAAAQAAPSGMVDWELPAPGPGGELLFELPFTLTRANARGMFAFLHAYLQRHAEPTSEDFNCRLVKAELAGSSSGTLSTLLWLAPYDLDVSQTFALRITPATEGGAVCRAALQLQRLSGSEEAWLRTNRRFLDLIRHQFLLWRSLPQEQRDRFIAEGEKLAATTPAPTP